MAKSKTTNKIPVKFKKLTEDAIIPSYAFDGDIGLDVTAITCEYDAEKDAYVYGTGLACETSAGIGNFLFVRSSNCKTDAYLANHVGIVDSATYRGEIKFIFKDRTSIEERVNHLGLWYMFPMISIRKLISNALRGRIGVYLSNLYAEAKSSAAEVVLRWYKENEYAPYDIGDRIGQMVFFEVKQADIEEVTELSETKRGDGGFGHTGK